jgi:predicted DNA-binding transcriptional regulator YafY
MRASRLVSILMLLQTRGRVSARALAEHLEVSTRTVYRDIDELSAAGVPVVVERGATGGFELLDGWRTTLTGLTPHEAQSLFVSGLPGPAVELGLGDTMASAQLKLLAALPGEWQAEAHRVSARFHVDLAGWYRRVAPAHHLRALADAVWADRRVRIGYESWDAVVERVLEPLGLVIKAGEWYLVARPASGSAARGRDPTPRTYRVANLRSLTVEGSFSRPARFDLSAYWSESTQRFERELNRGTARVRITARGRKLLRGVSAAVEEAIEQALAQAAAQAEPPAATQTEPPATQTEPPATPRASDGWLHVTIPIESLDHATGQLLALGTDVEVLEPAALRAQLRDTARAVAASYARPATSAARPAARRRRAAR